MKMTADKFRYLSVSLILCLGAISTFAALPVFRFGVWRDAEPTVVSVFALGGLAWLWNAWFLYSYPKIQLPRTIQISIALALWSTLSSIFAPYPLLSLLGGPQLAEGAALFFVLSGFLIAGYFAQGKRFITIAVCIGALVLIGYGAIVNPLPVGSPYKLFFFPDYLGVFAVLVPALMYLLAYNITAKANLRNAATLLGFIAGMVVAYLGDNRGAIVIVLVCGLGGWLITVLVQRFASLKINKAVLFLARLAIVVIPVSIFALILWVGRDYQANQLGEFTLFYSLWSRSLMFNITTHAFDDGGWLTYIFGNGFGHSLFAIQKYLVFSGQDFLNPTWDTFSRDYVHTHSIPYEILFSSGPIALILYLAIFIFWIKEAAVQHKAIVAATAASYMAIASLWFEFATVIPLLAFIMATTLGPASFKKAGAKLKILKATAGIIFAVNLIWASIWVYQQNMHLDKQVFLARQDKAFNTIADDHLRGNISFQRALREGYRYITAPVEGQSLEYDDFLWVQYLVERAQQQLRSSPGNALIMEYLLLAADFQNIPRPEKEYQALKSVILSEWSYAASILLETAPHRSELLIPYLTYAVSPQTQQSEREWASIILNDLYQYDNKNPVALWFIGQLELANTDNKKRIKAIENMVDAVEKHDLRRFLEIPDSLIQQLKTAHTALVQHSKMQ